MALLYRRHTGFPQRGAALVFHFVPVLTDALSTPGCSALTAVPGPLPGPSVVRPMSWGLTVRPVLTLGSPMGRCLLPGGCTEPSSSSSSSPLASLLFHSSPRADAKTEVSNATLVLHKVCPGCQLIPATHVSQKGCFGCPGNSETPERTASAAVGSHLLLSPDT